MKNVISILLLYFLSTYVALAQQKQKVFFSDVDNFWVAYDSIRSTTDSLRQMQYIQKLYIDKGTPGLKAFMEVRAFTPQEWVSSIRRYPRFWAAIRPNTERAKTAAQEIEPAIKKLKKLYPDLRPASIYFTIGALRSGGTVKDSLVLIGTELALGTAATDVSEFSKSKQTFLARHYKSEPSKNIVPLNIHEYVHTQEKAYGITLLGQALNEGVCDFVTECVTGKVMPLPYMAYGPKHEQELKEKFKVQMFSPYYGNWFYNQESDDPNHVPDLGYYMGYAICKTYYQQAKDKKRAIKELIELDFANTDMVEAFLAKTHYYAEPLNKTKILQAYEANRPVVTSITPAISTDGFIASDAQEIRVEFSKAMGPTATTELGPEAGGKTPVVRGGGFSADKKSFIYKVNLKPGQTYDLIITGLMEDNGFRSLDGFPLKSYELKFKTR
ncbi:Ig-like domain-containing protein [Hymenobacter sp. GOD-10R]|uniref:Ig-like domain-containing protein n=1 Tax=Hymenobacter sp. GOD-10R TaxID=3093922 RepID=UPI002D793167|nr:Ig-like domain-containing protein [Hymenobacter sp. GOD-10R]WRQ27188.1 Ig-like domain-containing protein [Hymenobacter sp. GOD-10R]